MLPLTQKPVYLALAKSNEIRVNEQVPTKLNKNYEGEI